MADALNLQTLDNFIKHHCGSIERFIDILKLLENGHTIKEIAPLYNISASNLSRRLKDFTAITYKPEVWAYLENLNAIEKYKNDRERAILAQGSKIIQFTQKKLRDQED